MNRPSGLDGDKGKNNDNNEGDDTGNANGGTTLKRVKIASASNDTPVTTPNKKTGPGTNGRSPPITNPNHTPVTAKAQWAAVRASRTPRGAKR